MYDVIIIGGGIVGLATGFQLLSLAPKTKLLILEKEDSIAKHQTGNNSGVIHSGIYYKPNSLKALNCIKGYHQLINFCKEHGVAHEICGKIVVATEKRELENLNNLYDRGLANGLTCLVKLGPNEIKDKEPHVNGIAGI